MIRILIVDDNESIHSDFKKVLQGKNKDKLRNVEMALFGEDDPDFELQEPTVEYEIDDAFQGEDAIEMVDQAAKEGKPYSMIFMDVRMPPGMDGIQASARIWEKHPEIELVICTAHSDYSWGEMVKEIGASDKLQFLRKPFDMVTVQQMALACVKKFEARILEAEEMEQLRHENERQRENQRSLHLVAEQIGVHIREANQQLNELEQLAVGDAAQQAGLKSQLSASIQALRQNLSHVEQLLDKTQKTIHAEG